MSDWVKKITEKLMPANTTRVLVVDPDGLFSYAILQKAFLDAGYSIHSCKTALDVRRVFELELRGGERKTILVTDFPYAPHPDLRGEVLAISIGYRDLFPYFDAAALKGLSYNALCTLNELKPYETLGYDGTIRFLLENLYHVDLQALDASRTKERFLAALVDVVFHEDGMNVAVRDYLYNEGRICLAPLGKAIILKESLLSYLQDALESVGSGRESSCNLVEPLFVKALGYLVTRKLLEPRKISKDRFEALDPRLSSFFFVDEQEESAQRLESLLMQLGSTERTIQDVPSEWLDLGLALGEAYFLALSSQNADRLGVIGNTIDSLNIRFQDFLDRCYWQMFSLSGTRKPLVVTRVLEYMRAQPERRKALIVIDGMNTWQWHQISNALEAEGLLAKTGAVFSFLPSITAWSRQALFRGTKPDLNVGTEVEKKVFVDYWSSRGYTESEIAYTRFNSSIQLDIAAFPNAEVIGAVCTDLDDLMHGAIMGYAQLFQDTDTWIHKSGIVRLIHDLQVKGFRCYIISDHGNIEAHGIGSVSMSSRCLSNSRSKRHIEFTSDDIAKAYLVSHPEIKAGQRNTTVFLKDTSAFCSDSLVVTHGGSHVLEMLVPFGIVG
jgi:hypothetical protein